MITVLTTGQTKKGNAQVFAEACHNFDTGVPIETIQVPEDTATRITFRTELMLGDPSATAQLIRVIVRMKDEGGRGAVTTAVSVAQGTNKNYFEQALPADQLGVVRAVLFSIRGTRHQTTEYDPDGVPLSGDEEGDARRKTSTILGQLTREAKEALKTAQEFVRATKLVAKSETVTPRKSAQETPKENFRVYSWKDRDDACDLAQRYVELIGVTAGEEERKKAMFDALAEKYKGLPQYIRFFICNESEVLQSAMDLAEKFVNKTARLSSDIGKYNILNPTTGDWERPQAKLKR
jgi:hypothetical protein